MFDWFFKRPNNKVFLGLGHLEVTYKSDFYAFKPSAELKEWLEPYKGEYSFKYDYMTGKRWIVFKDKNVAVMCRLVFA